MISVSVLSTSSITWDDEKDSTLQAVTLTLIITGTIQETILTISWTLCLSDSGVKSRDKGITFPLCATIALKKQRQPITINTALLHIK